MKYIAGRGLPEEFWERKSVNMRSAVGSGDIFVIELRITEYILGWVLVAQDFPDFLKVPSAEKGNSWKLLERFIKLGIKGWPHWRQHGDMSTRLER